MNAVDPAVEQAGFAHRFDWGPDGLAALAPACDVVVVVDVLGSGAAAQLAASAVELGAPFVLAGAFRNAAATARRAMALAGGEGAIGVIAAGERPAVEDLLAAGAVLHVLDPSAASLPPASSPEALAARAAFLDARPMLRESLERSVTGRVLTARGRGHEIEAAAQLDVTDVALQMIDGGFVGV